MARLPYSENTYKYEIAVSVKYHDDVLMHFPRNDKINFYIVNGRKKKIYNTHTHTHTHMQHKQ